MAGRSLTPRALAFAASVIVVGALAGGAILALSPHAPGAPRAGDGILAAFAILAVASPVFTFTCRRNLASKVDHQISGALAYPLLFLGRPDGALAVFAVSVIADGLVNRRRPLSVAFNVGQLSIATAAATAVHASLAPTFPAAALDARSAAILVVTAATLALVGESLTQTMVSLASRRPVSLVRSLTPAAILAEAVCVAFGLLLAALWRYEPWSVALGLAALGLQTLLLRRLGEREAELEREQGELRSLQDLGLRIGAELDEERARATIVRTAAEALDAAGALLAVPAGDGTLRAVAGHGANGGAIFPAIEPSLDESGGGGAAAALGAAGAVAVRLAPRGAEESSLVVFRGEDRRPFDPRDVRQLEALARFSEVALANARLIAEQSRLQERALQNEKLSALGTLISGVAHELNNPLTGVLGFAELLANSEDDPRRRERLEMIRAESRRAGRIVNNLLTFSRKHATETVSSDLNRVVERALDLRAHALSVRGIDVVRDFDPCLPTTLLDPHQIQQVVLNLLLNAEQAMAGSGCGSRIEVRTRMEGERLVVSVADDGPGIPEEILPEIWNPFFTTKEVGKGTGLGLSLCFGIVRSHDGTIRVEPVSPRGTRFVFELPWRQADEPAIDVRRPKTRRIAVVGRALVVDDEPTVVEMVRESLRSTGWEVDTAREGAEALRLLTSGDYDAILVDLLMPGMNGPALFEALRLERPDLVDRVLFETGGLAYPDAAAFLERSGRPVLVKPFTPDQLLSALDGLPRPLSRRRGSGARRPRRVARGTGIAGSTLEH